jgi:hypothetical protein
VVISISEFFSSHFLRLIVRLLVEKDSTDWEGPVFEGMAMLKWIIFIIVIVVAAAFTYAELRPSILDGHLGLKKIDSKIREILGLQAPKGDDLKEWTADQARRIIQDEDRAREVDRLCGVEPKNPLSVKEAPTNEEIQRYMQSYRDWQQCIQNVQGKAEVPEGIKRMDRSIKLDEFHERDEATGVR